jgi:hypothetical protein
LAPFVQLFAQSLSKCDISASNCAITCGPLAHFVQLFAQSLSKCDISASNCAITCGPLAHFVQLCAIFIKNATFPQVIVPLLAALWRILFNCAQSLSKMRHFRK